MGGRGDEGDRGQVLLLCRVDVTAHDLAVDWTNGALFRFGSRREAEAWASGQSERVHGTFYVTTGDGEAGPVPADLHLRYRSR